MNNHNLVNDPFGLLISRFSEIRTGILDIHQKLPDHHNESRGYFPLLHYAKRITTHIYTPTRLKELFKAPRLLRHNDRIKEVVI